MTRKSQGEIMRQFLLAIIIFFAASSYASAAIREIVYDGKEIYVHAKKNHITMVMFPEPVDGVIRGFGADSYVIQRNNKEKNILEIMPTENEVAEMTVDGVSGENYVLRCIAKDDFDTKLKISSVEQAVKHLDILTEDLETKKSESAVKQEKEIVTPLNILPEAVVENHQPAKSPASLNAGSQTGIPDPKSNGGLDSDLPAALNLKITLKGNELPLKIYFSTISQVTGYNIITTPEIESQKTSVNLENIEVWRALKSLLYKFGWGFKVSKEDLIITAIETRIYNVRMPAVEQSFIDQTSNESFDQNQSNSNGNASNTSQDQNVKIGTKITYENLAKKISLWDDLENNIKAMITPKVGSYSLSKSSATVIVTDRPGVLDQIAQIVDSTNEILSRQQTFEIQIYEVDLSNSNETGIDWQAVETSTKGQNVLNLATNFSSVGFIGGQLLSLSGGTNNSGNNGVTAFLKALASQGDVHTISKPKITVTNLFPAVIQEVTSIPFISGTGETIGNNISQSNVTTSTTSTGLTMRLDGKISDDNKTVLNISVSVNTLDSMTTVPVGNGLSIQEPQVSTKSMTTNVEIEPNKTLILGGLMSTNKNNSIQGVPYLSKIPFLGNAFEYKNNSVTKSELVIIITPVDMVKNP